MSGSIRLSPKHGVNPSLSVCFFCGEEKNELVLPGLICSKEDHDVEAPRKAVWNREPCDKCKDWMRAGVIFISVKDGDPDKKNPYRTGGWCVIKEDAVRRMPMNAELCDQILKSRFAFVEDKIWDMIGLPRGEHDNKSE